MASNQLWLEALDREKRKEKMNVARLFELYYALGEDLTGLLPALRNVTHKQRKVLACLEKSGLAQSRGPRFFAEFKGYNYAVDTLWTFFHKEFASGNINLRVLLRGERDLNTSIEYLIDRMERSLKNLKMPEKQARSS